MSLIQLFIQIDAARETIHGLGESGLVQFKDLNVSINPLQRNFINEVKQAEDMERQIGYFMHLIDEAEFKPELLYSEEEPDDEESGKDVSIAELDEKLEGLEQELQESVANNDKLRRNLDQLKEYRKVLKRDAEFFSSSKKHRNDLNNSSILEDDTFGDESMEMSVYKNSKVSTIEGSSTQPSSIYSGLQFGYVTGVAPVDRKELFERILWRVTRGNLFLRAVDLKKAVNDPSTGKPVSKFVFIIFYQGDKVGSRIKKVCEAVSANLYPVPKNQNERERIAKDVGDKLDDLNQVYESSKNRQDRVLLNIARQVEGWREKIVSEKAIYNILNCFTYDTGRRCIVGEGWCPSEEIDNIRKVLVDTNRRSAATIPTILHIVPTEEIPPTYYKTNKFTASFQGIVDAYGIARYQEVNPGVFTIITFPFLFAVMFGDCGHGFLMLLFALFMVLREDTAKKLMTGSLDMIFNGRYLILLMALFSIYVGLIYNDCFSIPLPIFASRWLHVQGEQQLRYNWDAGYPYPFGVDYGWKGTSNELIYYNSLKMKMSILLGFTQMMTGICLKFFNGIYYNKPYDVWFEFIPQFLFMSSIFGYLCVLIIIKWCTNYAGHENDAPSILNTLISMFLSPFNVDNPFYDGQQTIQNILIIIGIGSVPFMLFPKPFLLKRDWQRSHASDVYKGFEDPLQEHATRESALTSTKGIANRVADQAKGRSVATNPSSSVSHSKGNNRLAGSDDSDSSPESDVELEDNNGSSSTAPQNHRKLPGKHEEEDHHEHFDFGEIFVHQIIHTIEFVLGAVSNTASYLRLWALSLAHAQLSAVFWVRILVLGLTTGNFFVIFCIWPVWAVITMGVLMGMESISAFLHALRLHWVEFMNKFYYGDGVAFKPFNLEDVVHPPKEES